MKSKLSRIISVVLVAALICATSLAVSMDTEAAPTSFSGTVSDKTTSDTLFLITSGGTMQIKIDSATDTSQGKFLLPGYKVTCSCQVGADEYWHALSITGSSKTGAASVDTSKTATVTGSVAKGTNEEMLFLSTKDGTMEIKLDPTTDVSGVKAFIMGKNLQVTCSRGSDAYMHALSVTDKGGTTAALTTADTTQTAVQTVTTQAPAYSVTGTVDKATTSSVLHLNTSGGKMEMKIDAGASASCHMLMPGTSVTAGFYRGSDEWLHTSVMVNNTSKLAAVTTLDSQQLTVSGTVTESSSESTMFLSTSGGTMQIRMDASTDFSGCPVLVKNKSVQVVCQRGADEYYHAVKITAK